ncbi:MAG: sulfatase, partial [Akkermansiaceae bacterium]
MNEMTRRHFLERSSHGLGSVALASLLNQSLLAERSRTLPGKAKRIIYLFQSGGPPQMDLFDPKPQL